MTTTRKVRVPLTDSEVTVKGDKLSKLELKRVRVDEDRKKAARGYRVELKDLNEEIRNLATDRDTKTEEREIDVDQRVNLKQKRYEWWSIATGEMVDHRKMTTSELKAEQQMKLEDAPAAKKTAAKDKVAKTGGNGAGDAPVKLVHSTANKPKGPAKGKL